LSQIEITGSSSRRSSASREVRAGLGQRRLNVIVAWLLVLLVGLAPLPFASVRPAFSALWATYIGLVGLLYFGLLIQRGEKLRFDLARVRLPATLLGLAGAALLVQLLPIFGSSIALPDGSAIDISQLTVAPGMTTLMLCRQLSYGLFAILVLQVCVNDTRRAQVLQAILVIVVGYAIYGMIALESGDTILGLPKWAYFGAATGPMVNRNSFATFLGMGAVLALSMLAGRVVNQADRHKDDGRIAHNFSNMMLLGVTYGFLLIVIISTQSRMGLAATLIASTAVVLLTLSAVRNFRIGGYAVMGLVAVLALGLVFFGGGVFERLGSLESATEVRGDLYRQTWDLIILRPLTGFGGGTFELAFPLVQHLPVSPDLVWEKTHNTYLALWSELGLIAGSLPILAVAIIALWFLRNTVTRRGSWRPQVAGLAVIVLAGFHSLADFSLEIPANTFLFIALVAAGLAAMPDDRRSQHAIPNAR
jgi:O-antigen ligase